MRAPLLWICNAIAIWLASIWVSGIGILSPAEHGDWGKVIVVLVVAIVFSAVNAVVKPLLTLLSLPLVVLTLGLFLLVINALMLLLTAKLSELTDYGLRVDGFWPAVWGGLVIALVNWVLGAFVPAPARR
ncbi:phage holin family protein [Skermania piniformis]|uniref:Phage holin family protein n=1 Tax=Skermania pinensis TaxID=39122 RepID=A0ABX8SFE9_9ACTN|nr:phage holin family protein [Skermania piniformis]QXQ14416.1 phage holin family protein [Skermania piniformis]